MAKLITPQVIVATDAAIVPTEEDALDGGNEFVNSGRMFIYAKNNHADTDRTIKVNSQVLCSQNEDHDLAVVITAAQDFKMVGPFPKDRFNDENGKVQITYIPSAGTDIKIAVLEVP